MISASNIDVGRDPALYGLDLVRDLGIKEPPINEYVAADYHGYNIIEVNPSDYVKEYPNIKNIFCKSNAHLIPDKNIILINAEFPQWKKRTGVFHEIAHNIIPWHKHLNYNYLTYQFNQTHHWKYEREASHCGAEIQMPRDLFVPDVLDLEPGIDAIKRLAFRYQASLETTAIQYVESHPLPCAVILVEPRDDLSSQLTLPFMESDTHKSIVHRSHHPLKIKYAVKSAHLRLNIRSGIKIDYDNPIYDTWITRSPRRAELHSSVLGVKAREVYTADILPQGNLNTIIIFLWRPHR